MLLVASCERPQQRSNPHKKERASASTQESAQRETELRISELYFLPSVPYFFPDLPPCHHTSANTLHHSVIHSFSQISSLPSLSSSPRPPSLAYILSYYSKYDFLPGKFGKPTPNDSEVSLTPPRSLTLSLSYSLSLSLSLSLMVSQSAHLATTRLARKIEG